jgi:hypothetical protein
MADRYFIFADGEREGPYSHQELRTMLEDESLSFKDYCIRDGGSRRQRLDALFELVPDSAKPDGEDEGEGEHEGEEDEEDDEEEWEYEEVAAGDREEEHPESGEDRGRVLYCGHPSLLTYPVSLLLAAVCGIGGYLLGPASLVYFVVGSLVAVGAVVFVVVDRSTRVYIVTLRRVESVWGLVARSSNEVLVRDIRTINVRKAGLLGLLGIGTVDFSSAGDHIDVSFGRVWAAHRVKLLVRRLQDADGSDDEES